MGKREEILDAAEAMFSQRGFRAASMNDLAKAVNLTKPSLYHYVSGKEALLVELYERTGEEGIDLIRGVMADPTIEPLEALRRTLVQRILFTCEHKHLLQIFFEDEAELPDELRERMIRQRAEYEANIVSLLNRAAEAGAIRLNAPVRIVVNTVLGAIHWVYRWYNPDGPRSPEQIAEDMTGVLLPGLITRD
jgi:TetR/AcrR family transcriptional regulator, cholesterol catabolism regulator